MPETEEKALCVTPSEPSITKRVREWLEECFGLFSVEQVYNELGITTPINKTAVRVALHRECERGTIEMEDKNGTYKKIDKEADDIPILNITPTALPLILPSNIGDFVNIYSGNVIVFAGAFDAGKTALALNTAYENRDKFEIYYWSSEMGEDELKTRFDNFGYPLEEWKKIHFKRRGEDFHQVVKPNAVNIIDYLEVIDGGFHLVGNNIRKIFEKLNKGIAIINLQKDPGSEYAWGGAKTLDKARLYLALDQEELTIVKAKNRKPPPCPDPHGLCCRFTLTGGTKFTWLMPWFKKPAKSIQPHQPQRKRGRTP